MDVERLFATIIERLRATANVNAVYGEPRVIAGRTIVPVAAVSYRFGGGAAEPSPATTEGQEVKATGAGGGGGASAKPIAILGITEERTRVIPILDFNRLAFWGLIGLFLTLLLARRKGK